MSPISSPIKTLKILEACPQFIEAATVSRAISLENEKANNESTNNTYKILENYSAKVSHDR
jgi:hypothetical protein